VTLDGGHVSILLTYAQVSIAFAGFAGVIGAFSRFRVDQRVVAFRVRGMVSIGLTALIVSLAPTAPGLFNLEEALCWRIAAGGFAVLATLLFVVLLRQVLPLFRAGLLRTQAINVVWYSLAAIMIAMMAGIAAGRFAGAAPGLYFLALFFMLILCVYNFLMMILAVQLDNRA
jgi:hypothetical protein